MVEVSGIYALACRDGGAINPRDAMVLGLAEPRGASVSVRGVDHRMASALHRADDHGIVTVLVGHLDNAADLAARMSLSPSTPPALLARAALSRFGPDTPVHMLGEWSLLHYDAARRLTLMQSAALRDRIFYALHGSTIAVAPDLLVLRELAWVGDDLDDEGMLYAVGRAPLRARNAGRTILPRVQRLEAGGSAQFDHSGVRISSAQALTPQPRWQGSFAEAVEEAERLLHVIVGERMRRAGPSVAMLSGGLDSSTLAWLAAGQRGAETPLWLITSVAPPGCSRPDERAYADLVAAALGMGTAPLFPDQEVNLYRPCLAILHGANGPPMTTRHGMTVPFQRFADAQGAALMFDGIYGEMTLTADHPVATWRNAPRRAASALRRRLRRSVPVEDATGAFNIRLARHRLASLPPSVAEAIAAPPEDESIATDAGLCGYRPGAVKALRTGTEAFSGAVREDFPFRDLRLLRLFAGFPVDYLAYRGLTRSFARHMLKGHLPDAIRLRRRGLPASPDHLDRLRWQASAARDRIAEFRHAEIDDWLDLDWLDSALQRVAATGPSSYGDANDVQLTAVTAEYLLSWRRRT